MKKLIIVMLSLFMLSSMVIAVPTFDWQGVIADVNNDQVVNILDLVLVRNVMFSPNNTNCQYTRFCNGRDVNFDGVVDMNDLFFVRDRLGYRY